MGRVTHRLAQRFREVWAVDISPEMIARAKERWAHLTNVHFELISGSDLAPVQSGAVDLVFSFITLHHVVDPGVVVNYLAETARVLTVGGLALLHLHTVERNLVRRALRRLRPRPPVEDWWNRGFEPRAVATAAPPATVVTSPVWRGCRVSMAEVRRALRRAGLDVVRSEGEGTFWTLLSLRKPGPGGSEAPTNLL
jgi:SAM-dependent methyltransferase